MAGFCFDYKIITNKFFYEPSKTVGRFNSEKQQNKKYFKT